MRRVAGVVAATSVSGLAALAWTGSSRRPSDEHLRQPVSALDAALAAVDTGDLVVFDRKCDDFGYYGAVLCHAAKFNFGRPVPYDHVGVAVRHGDAPDAVHLVEADVQGVLVRSLRKRVELSRRSNAIFIRPLQAPRTPEMRAHVDEFVREVRDKPYKTDVLQMFRAAVDTRTKRLHLEGLRELCEAHDELHRLTTDDPSNAAALAAAAQRVQELDDRATRRPDGWKEGGLFLNRQDLSSFFCSELVAATYQRMGLLPPLPPSNEYMPVHFVPGQEHRVPLLRGAKLQDTMVRVR